MQKASLVHASHAKCSPKPPKNAAIAARGAISNFPRLPCRRAASSMNKQREGHMWLCPSRNLSITLLAPLTEGFRKPALLAGETLGAPLSREWSHSGPPLRRP